MPEGTSCLSCAVSMLPASRHVPARRYVEEEDMLALALGGRFVQHPAPLLCDASLAQPDAQEVQQV
jgi:hypothetical protein